MIIDELKSKKISSIEKVVDYLSNSEKGFYYLSDNLAELIANSAQDSHPNNCIVLNSNIGEILSKCNKIDNRLGIDISSKNIDIANYLYPNLHFKNIDPLEYETKDKFDSVICYPILGQRIKKNGKETHSEKLYVSKSLELLSEEGTAVLLLPKSFLVVKEFEDLRREINQKYRLKRIITLPIGVLNNTVIEFSLVEITKQIVEKTEFCKINSSQLENKQILSFEPDFSVLSETILERWDFEYYNPTHNRYEEELKKYETKKIEDLVEIVRGAHIKGVEKKSSGDFQIINNKNIEKGYLEATESDKYVGLTSLNNKAILRAGDIVFSQRGIHNKRIEVYIHEGNNNRFIANSFLIILRGKNAEYVTTYLNTKNGFDLFNQQIKRHSRGVIFPNVSIDDLKKIQIPILPIEDLELASKRKLEKLSYEELLKINDKYIALKAKFDELKEKNTSTAHEEQLNAMQAILYEVLQNQKKMTKKLEDIQSSISELAVDFESIKTLPRDIDEKINRLNESLDTKLNELITDKKQLDFYITEIKGWFDFYDLLELKSQKYLPEAEYIFDHISKLENPDYSPFILQYCRALENELLKKIFRAYVQSLFDREIEITKEFEWDFGRKESGKANSENTSKLAKHLQRCMKKSEESWFFELGSMEFNLRYLTGKTAEKSPLLIDLKQFVLGKFEQEILNIEYLDEIKTIIRDYRNQSAHPNLIGTEKAVKFHKQMKDCLIGLLENYKK
jgi:hypothetical protein